MTKGQSGFLDVLNNKTLESCCCYRVSPDQLCFANLSTHQEENKLCEKGRSAAYRV